MSRGIRTACILLGTAFLFSGICSQGVFGQEEPARTIPDALRRPERGESPRYPHDVGIGELGQGQAPLAAYRFARELLEALRQGNKTAPVLENSPGILTGSLLDEISGIEPRSYRIGGGRTEADGNVSFLVRFLGQAESISGELFVRQDAESERWFLDDLLLEEKRALIEIKDNYRYDFSPYERFF